MPKRTVDEYALAINWYVLSQSIQRCLDTIRRKSAYQLFRCHANSMACWERDEKEYGGGILIASNIERQSGYK